MTIVRIKLQTLAYIMNIIPQKLMTNTTILAGIIFGTIIASGLTIGNAEAAVFAKYDGIDGESKDANHDKWIDVLNVDWGASLPNAGVSSAKMKSIPIVQDFVITVEYDKASPKLQEKCLLGEVIPKLEIEQTATYGGAREVYLKYELKNVMITSFQISASGNDEVGPPTVVYSTNFEEIKVTYTEYDHEGSAKGQTVYEYSVAKNTGKDTRVIPQSFEVPGWYLNSINWANQGLISQDEISAGLEYLKQI